MDKKVVVLGGGSGLSCLLRGLKKFPLDISAIVSVSDDGKSTGRLREEFNIPAVGDIRKVLTALSEAEPAVRDLLNYRFKTSSDLDGHTVGNLLLTAAQDIKGNMSEGIKMLSNTLNLKGKVIPLAEDKDITLVAKLEDGKMVEGEHKITLDKRKIKKVFYKSKPNINKEALVAIKNADLIILSMGSVYTSIIPTLLSKEILKEIEISSAPILYTCNMMTQPGETDNFKASDHVKLLNKYLGKRKIDIVIANNGEIKEEIQRKYETLEQKDHVICDLKDNCCNQVITDDFVEIKDETIRHNLIKLCMHIFKVLI